MGNNISLAMSTIILMGVIYIFGKDKSGIYIDVCA